MTLPKRKRKPTRTTSNKRPKYIESGSDSDKEETTSNSQEEWEALRILAQEGEGSESKYLIEWAGIDPATGKQWEPTWEKASNASESLRKSWEQEKVRTALEGKKTTTTGQSNTQRLSASEQPQAQAARTRATRQRQIVESSESSISASEIDSSTEASQSAVASPSTRTIDIRTPILNRISPQVNIGLPGNSFNCSEYESRAEIPESLPSPGRSITEVTNLDSLQLCTSQRAFRASGIVPETQSSAGDVSYIQVKQEKLGWDSHSSPTDESIEEDLIGYSGLLNVDAAPRFGVRAQSPATSIAETVADTTQDLQSQQQLGGQWELPEILETLGSPIIPVETDKAVIHSDSVSRHHINTALAQSQESQYLHDFHRSDQVSLIENTTRLAHRASSHCIQQLPQERSGCRTLATTTQQPRDTSVQSFANSVGFESLVVADTPPISQSTSTVQAGVADSELTHPAHQPETPQQGVEEDSVVFLTECATLEENAQFPFHSQYPVSFDIRCATKSTKRVLTGPSKTINTQCDTGVYHRRALNESEESTIIDRISQPIQANTRGFESTTVSIAGDTVGQIDCTIIPRSPSSAEPPLGSREHNTQLLLPGTYFSTQNDSIKSIQVTANVLHKKYSSRGPRYDSSQETSEHQSQSTKYGSSPTSNLTGYLCKTPDLNVPPRPAKPTLSSSRLNMAEDTAARIERQLKELKEADRAANPYVPRRQRVRAYQPSLTTSTDAVASGSSLQSGTTPVPPVTNTSAEGTRSPSTVPDRSPALPAQTSLRTVAITNAKDKAAEALLENPLAATTTTTTTTTTDADLINENIELMTRAAATTAATKPLVSPKVGVNDDAEEMSDIDNTIDDNDEGSIYNDDLQLEREEYIVPLFIEGRQSDTYSAYIKQKSDLLDAFLFDDSASPDLLEKVEDALTYMKAVETHPDLIYAEAESATDFGMRSAIDVQHGAEFGVENSIKFKFLRELFNHLRERDLHIVLLLEQDNDALFNILRTFFTAANYNYSMPTKGHQFNASQDALTITIFSNITSPTIQPANLIICLDGVQSASQIRQSSWAMAFGDNVPVLHLLIPQTVSHIERYIMSNLERRTRIYEILAGLGQIQSRNEIGNPIDTDTPGATEAARLIASWLVPDADQESSGWPLPSIGSVRSFMEYNQTQQSVASTTSSPAPRRIKRPLEADDSDLAKRVRYTPQPRVVPNSSANHENEITRISDSMPGTAMSEEERLRVRLKEAYSEHLRIEKEHQEKEIMWDKQQTEHENRAQGYRKLFNEKAEVDRAHESMTRNRDKLRTQLEAQAIEVKVLRDELEAQRSLGMESENQKDVEITRLRKQLEATQLERDRAIKSVQSIETTLEYTKEQYRAASKTVSQLQNDLSSLEMKNAKLAQQASGEAFKLKQVHFNRSVDNLIEQIKVLKSENSNIKVLLKQKEDELLRVKSNPSRMGYSTRAQSTTPQPRTRSRATSPTREREVRGRVTGLRYEER